jgi:hypothetical protein
MNQRGGLLLENLLAVSLVALVSVSFMPLIPRLATTAEDSIIKSKLASIGEYVGNYLFRWVAFDPSKKPVFFSEYGEGSSFDVTGEKRVNNLIWAQDLDSGSDYMTDHYKTDITFWETTRRDKRAVVKVLVWYDRDLNGTLDSGEPSFSYSSMLAESR